MGGKLRRALNPTPLGEAQADEGARAPTSTDETQSPGPVPVSQLLLADQRACVRADHDRRTP